MQQDGKRRKTKDADSQWSLTFTDPYSLVQVVKTISNVISLARLRMQERNGKYVLQFTGNDKGWSVVVAAEVPIDKFHFGSKIKDHNDVCLFVEMESLLAAIESTTTTGTTKISYTEKGEKAGYVHVHIKDNDMSSRESLGMFKPFADDMGLEYELQNMEHKMVIEFDTGALRDMVKKGKKLSVEYLTIEVFKLSYPSCAKKFSMTSLRVRGDNSEYEVSFESEIRENEDGSMIVIDAGGECDADNPDRYVAEQEQLFRGTFPISKIEAFVKNFPKRMLIGKAKTGQALMLEHDLSGGGDTESFIRFMVAPINEDVDD